MTNVYNLVMSFLILNTPCILYKFKNCKNTNYMHYVYVYLYIHILHIVGVFTILNLVTSIQISTLLFLSHSNYFNGLFFSAFINEEC